MRSPFTVLVDARGKAARVCPYPRGRSPKRDRRRSSASRPPGILLITSEIAQCAENPAFEPSAKEFTSVRPMTFPQTGISPVWRL